MEKLSTKDKTIEGNSQHFPGLTESPEPNGFPVAHGISYYLFLLSVPCVNKIAIENKKIHFK